MNPTFASKMDILSASIFVQLEEKIQAARTAGREIYNMSVGTPDLPPAPHIVKALAEAAADPANYKYALTDKPELTAAVQRWYKRRYDVTLVPEEICALVGSQDGLAHLPLVVLNPGDMALVPNPGYPIFHNGIEIASGKRYEMPLLEATGFLPDLEAIPSQVAYAAKLMILSYPMNPLCKLAPPEFFEKAVWFAKKYDIVILHDNAYSELYYDGRRCGSFLATKGAMDVGIEFNSLSKSHNMTGARISFALGNQKIIGALRAFKSNVDYGIFHPIQYAAIAALDGPQTCVEQLRQSYQSRRDTLVRSFGEAGWAVTPPEATMFAWTKLPESAGNDSMAFCLRLIEEAGVTVVPGISFGSLGEGYVRIALVQDEERIQKAAANIGHMLQK